MESPSDLPCGSIHLQRAGYLPCGSIHLQRAGGLPVGPIHLVRYPPGGTREFLVFWPDKLTLRSPGWSYEVTACGRSFEWGYAWHDKEPCLFRGHKCPTKTCHLQAMLVSICKKLHVPYGCIFCILTFNDICKLLQYKEKNS